MGGAMADRRILVFLSHGDATALRLAGSAALAAAAAGDRVDVFLFGGAVAPVVAAHGESAEEPGALLHQAREVGTCRLVACSASVIEEKVPLDEANRTLDAVVGWPTILEWSAGVSDRYFF
jgi:hypothetical protein